MTGTQQARGEAAADSAMSAGSLCLDMAGARGSVGGKGAYCQCSQLSPNLKAVGFQLSEISHSEKGPLSFLVCPTIMSKAQL